MIPGLCTPHCLGFREKGKTERGRNYRGAEGRESLASQGRHEEENLREEGDTYEVPETAQVRSSGTEDTEKKEARKGS